MFYHNINPVLLDLGPLEIRWYGLMYIVGILIIYYTMIYLVKVRKESITKEDLTDFMLWSILGMLLGGRLGYILFYNLSFYLSNPLKVLALWEGGMSFHGGLIGVVIAGLWFCKKKNISFYEMADLMVIPLGLALFFGRLGNFINAELYGRITDASFCVDYSQSKYVSGIEGCRWPSQLFEAGKNLLIFGTLWTIKLKELPKGFLFWLFVAMYGVLRFFIEFIREPDSQLGFILFEWMTMGQVLCILMVLLGGYMMWYVSKKQN